MSDDSEQRALLAAARKMARARGWPEGEIDRGELRGTLPYDEARAALEGLREVEGARVEAPTLEECMTLLAALTAWDVWPEATRPGPQRTQVLEAALRESRKVDALVVKVEGWYTEARERHTAEVEDSLR